MLRMTTSRWRWASHLAGGLLDDPLEVVILNAVKDLLFFYRSHRGLSDGLGTQRAA